MPDAALQDPLWIKVLPVVATVLAALLTGYFSYRAGQRKTMHAQQDRIHLQENRQAQTVTVNPTTRVEVGSVRETLYETLCPIFKGTVYSKTPILLHQAKASGVVVGVSCPRFDKKEMLCECNLNAGKECIYLPTHVREAQLSVRKTRS